MRKVVSMLVLMALLLSCRQGYQVLEVRSHTQEIRSDMTGSAKVEEMIRPYREHIEQDLNKVLCYNAQPLIKQQTQLNIPLGNLMADATKQQVDKAYFQRTGEHIDFVLLNYGGIRSSLPQGDITVRSAYEIMPFENKVVVAVLKGKQIKEMAQYLMKENKAHPLSKEFRLVFNDKGIEELSISGKAVDDDTEYRVATSDYLVRGGDRMNFFLSALQQEDMDYTLRNVLIDYFSSVDTLRAVSDRRFLKE